MNADEEMVPSNADVDAIYPDADPDAFQFEHILC